MPLPQPLPAVASSSFTSPLRGRLLGPWRPLKTYSRVALPGQRVALQAGAHGNVGEGVAAATALDGDAGGLGTDPRGRDDDAGDLHQVRHHV